MSVSFNLPLPGSIGAGAWVSLAGASSAILAKTLAYVGGLSADKVAIEFSGDGTNPMSFAIEQSGAKWTTMAEISAGWARGRRIALGAGSTGTLSLSLEESGGSSGGAKVWTQVAGVVVPTELGAGQGAGAIGSYVLSNVPATVSFAADTFIPGESLFVSLQAQGETHTPEAVFNGVLTIGMSGFGVAANDGSLSLPSIQAQFAKLSASAASLNATVDISASVYALR